jgi:hypothetical protein
MGVIIVYYYSTTVEYTYIVSVSIGTTFFRLDEHDNILYNVTNECIQRISIINCI